MRGDMEPAIEFVVPGRAPASSSPNSRIDWRGRHSAAKDYAETVTLIAMLNRTMGQRTWQRATVTLTQRAVRLRDHDNFAASFKPGLDAIVRAGIIADDNPDCIDLVLRAEKVKTKRDEEVVVTITKREEG